MTASRRSGSLRSKRNSVQLRKLFHRLRVLAFTKTAPRALFRKGVLLETPLEVCEFALPEPVFMGVRCGFVTSVLEALSAGVGCGMVMSTDGSVATAFTSTTSVTEPTCTDAG